MRDYHGPIVSPKTTFTGTNSLIDFTNHLGAFLSEDEKRVLIVEEEVKNILKKRAANIEEAKSAENFGIIIGLKTWQKRLDRALKLKSLLESYNKKITVFAMREITSEALSQFPGIDAFVNTACPRLFLETFKSPVLTPQEALVVLGHTSWETLCRKGWFER